MEKEKLLQLLKLLHDNIDLMYRNCGSHSEGLCLVTRAMTHRDIITTSEEYFIDQYVKNNTEKLGLYSNYNWPRGDVDRRMYWLKEQIRKIEKELKS